MDNLIGEEKKVYLLLTASAVSWGIHAVAAKYAVSEISPMTVVFFRFAWVSIILIAVAVYTEGKKFLPSIKQLGGLMILGITGFFGNNYFYFSGIAQTSAANATLIAASNPVITAFLTAVFLKERLEARQWTGIVMSFIGVAIIVTKGSWQVITNLTFNYGDILMFFAAVCWSLYSILGKSIVKDITVLSATAWGSLFGSLFLGIIAVKQGFNGYVSLSGLGWLCMIYMIIGSGALAFLWWTKGVTVVGPTKAAIFTNVIPLSGVLCAALLLHEQITLPQYIGAAMILSGVWLITHTHSDMVHHQLES